MTTGGGGQPCSSSHPKTDEEECYHNPRPPSSRSWRRRRLLRPRRPRRTTSCRSLKLYHLAVAATAAAAVVVTLCGIGDGTTVTAASSSAAAASSSGFGRVGVWQLDTPLLVRSQRYWSPFDNKDLNRPREERVRRGTDPYLPLTQLRWSSGRDRDDATVVVGSAAKGGFGLQCEGDVVTALRRLRGGEVDSARHTDDDDGDDDCSEGYDATLSEPGGKRTSTTTSAAKPSAPGKSAENIPISAPTSTGTADSDLDEKTVATTTAHSHLETGADGTAGPVADGGGGGSFSNSAERSYHVSRFAIRGARPYMEDEHFVSTPRGEFAAVFDGHGGAAVSRYLRRNFYANVVSELDRRAAPPGRGRELQTSSGGWVPQRRRSSTAAAPPPSPPSLRDCVDALRAAFAKVDGEVQRVSHWSFQGSTAVAVLLHEEAVGEGRLLPHDEQKDEEDDGGNERNGHHRHRQRHSPRTTATMTILSANVGDSRAVLSRDGRAVDLTVDHKPNVASERVRIEALGGTVEWYGLTEQSRSGGSGSRRPVEGSGVYRINGNLAVSRAVGDRSERPLVNAEVDVETTRLIPRLDEFVVLASDGLWDVVSSQEAVSFVRDELGLDGDSPGGVVHSRRKRDGVAKSLAREAIRRGSLDNVTVLIVWLLD